MTAETGMPEKPFMCTDISERKLLEWILDYTMDRVMDTFRSIPDEALFARPRPNMNSPAWIFGHIAVTEREHVGRFVEGVDDIPEEFRVFRARRPSDDDVRRAVKSKEAMVDYWKDVREKTRGYLARVTDEHLKRRSEKTLHPKDHPNYHNPIREWFVMTIQHQNYHWGQLSIMARLIAGDGAA